MEISGAYRVRGEGASAEKVCHVVLQRRRRHHAFAPIIAAPPHPGDQQVAAPCYELFQASQVVLRRWNDRPGDDQHNVPCRVRQILGRAFPSFHPIPHLPQQRVGSFGAIRCGGVAGRITSRRSSVVGREQHCQERQERQKKNGEKQDLLIGGVERHSHRSDSNSARAAS